MDKILRKILVSPHYLVYQRKFSSKLIKNQPKEEFVIAPASRKDYGCIVELIKRFYVPDEPILSSIGYRLNPIMERLLIESMHHGLTLIAKCKYNGHIVGGCINETTTSRDPDLLDSQACNVSCPKTKQILHFYAYIARVPDLWNKYGEQEIFEASHVFVHKDKRGQGLATKLLHKSRMLAKDWGYQIYRVDASNLITAKVCEKMKMQLICQIPYNSFLDENMRPIFAPKPPNEFVSVYINELQKSS